MLKIKKLNAFTLSEMIVVLILTSIVIGMVFTVLNLVQKQMFGAQKNHITYSEHNLLKQSLWVDFNNYQSIEFNADTQKLKFSSAVDSVYYHFHETYITKDVDTFNIHIDSKSFYYKGKLITLGVLDALKVFPQKVKQASLFIYKENDAAAFIN